VHADEKLAAFIELEAVIRACGDCAGRTGEILSKLGGR
jgi:hypothetical protein